MPSPRPHRAVLAALAACAGAAHAQDQATIWGLGDFSITRFDGNRLAPDGSAIAGRIYDVVDSAAVLVPGLPPAALAGFGGDAEAFGIGLGPSGYVIAGEARHTSGDPEAFRWTANDGVRGLGDLPGGRFGSSVYGVSDDGRVLVGTGNSAAGYEALRWTEKDGLVGLGGLPGSVFGSGAGSTNHDGSVIAGASRTSVADWTAIIWTPSQGMVPLPLRSDVRTAAIADISADGTVVVGEATLVSGGREAFRSRDLGDMTLLGRLPAGLPVRAEATNADGSIVVGYEGLEVIYRPFIWTMWSGIEDLNDFLPRRYGLDLSGWELRRVTDISPDGRTLIGDGKPEAWIIRLPEAPICRADVTRDGALDVFDFIEYQNLFADGCTQPPAVFRGAGQISAIYGLTTDGDLVAGATEAPDHVALAGRLGLPLTRIGTPSDMRWEASAITRRQADGATFVVGTQRSASGELEGFRWSRDEGFRMLGDLPGGRFQSEAMDISDTGVIVGYSAPDSALFEAYRWTDAEGMIGLGTLSSSSIANAVSADGSVIVGWAGMPTGHQAFRWTETEGLVGLGVPDGASLTYANGLSDGGQFIVGEVVIGTTSLAFRWTESGGYEILGAPPGKTRVAAYDVSADGATVVGGQTLLGDGEAFIWTESLGMRDLKDYLQAEHGLDLSNWVLYAATAISADGRTIVGRGKNGGRLEGWSVTFPAPDCPADFDHDGELTLFDFLAFANLFAAGCD
ncbi:MAG: hypothetical protein ACF8R7_13395 [Phycisphaerales bacterium JB039]